MRASLSSNLEVVDGDLESEEWSAAVKDTDERHSWLLRTKMMIIEITIRMRTTDIRTIMIGRNLAGSRLSISVVVAAS